jgi:N-formylglutamate deformylase
MMRLSGCLALFLPRYFYLASGKGYIMEEFFINRGALLLHIPHSGLVIPEEYRGIYLYPQLLTTKALQAADLYTEELFRLPVDSLIFPYSRLLCDVERFRNPADEAMSKLGMWICYTHDMQGQELAHFDKQHVEQILTNYYDLHHLNLTQMVTSKLRQWGQVLIIDCHSFPENLPYYKPGIRPDICLGTDNYHTPLPLVTMAKTFLEKCGYSVAINYPFSGSLVPMQFYQKEQRIYSLMLEINRRLYCDTTNEKLRTFTKVQQDLRDFLGQIVFPVL